MAGIPLTWNDPIFNGVTTSSSITVQDGGTVSNKSITDTGSIASIVGQGSFTLDQVRINSEEGVRIGGSGDIVINNSYIETTGVGSDHADGIQAYSPGDSGNVTITNTTIVSHNTAATAGMFIADNYGGTITLNNVVFEGGPFGLRIAADNQDITVALKDVYFVGPFMYDPLLIQEVNAHIHITQWDNVRSATIVNGQLVPGDLIASPFPVEGGATPAPSAPAVDTLVAPSISSWSPDTGVTGDGVTSATKLTLKGTAAASSIVKVFDGSTEVGSATTDGSGNWSLTTSTLSNTKHALTATATDASGTTSAASSAVNVTVDNIAPNAPTLTADSVVNTDHVLLTGTAEANSTIKVYDGTTLVGTGTTNSTGSWSVTTSSLATGTHSLGATATDAAGNVSASSTKAAPVIASSTTVDTGSTAPTVTQPTVDPTANPVKFTALYKDAYGVATIKGSADAYSQVNLYEGSTQIGTTKADATGAWTFKSEPLSNTVHTITAQEVSQGAVAGGSSGSAILGTKGADFLSGTSGDDVFFGNGHPDTFIFATNFGHDVISDFRAWGRSHDVVTFDAHEVNSFAGVLAHAAQVGADTVISLGNDTLTLKNVAVTSLNSHDFHFA